MPRIVHHHATDPIRIDPATWPRDAAGALKPIWICACGISSTFPFCDGSHKICRNETQGVTYRYDPATKAVIEQSPPAQQTGQQDKPGDVR